MKINQIITESLSRIVYHYTNLYAGAKILQSGEFQLSSSYGSVEQSYSPKGQPYFLSTTRTKHGGYHEYIGNGAAMFVLDGNYYNQHYVSKPVDYWGNRNPEKAYGKASEAEDRIFSRTPTIPIDGVTAVHIYVKPMDEKERKSWGAGIPALARKCLIEAKKRGIPAYLYEDEDAWRNLDTKKSVSVTKRDSLRGQENLGRGYDRHRGYLRPWLELINSTDQNHLSKKAKEIRYSLMYSYDMQQAARGLATELANARKPGAGVDRNNAVNIITYMQKNGIHSVPDLVQSLRDKWKSISSDSR